METYRFVEYGKEILLCSVTPGVYELKMLDRGVQKIKFDEAQIVGLLKVDGSETYYLADKPGKLILFANNVFNGKLLKSGGKQVLLYQRDCDFFIKDLVDMEETALGSWCEDNLFFAGKEGAVTLRYLNGGKLVKTEYVTAECYDNHFGFCIAFRQAVCLRPDGLYDILYRSDDGYNLMKDEYVRINTNIVNKSLIFWFNKEKNGYEKIFEGKNLIKFCNAVFEEIPANDKKGDLYLLYYFDNREKILLARTGPDDEIRYSRSEVTINDLSWREMEGNSDFLDPVSKQVNEESESVEQKKNFWQKIFS